MTGEYVNYSEMVASAARYGVPVVRLLSIEANSIQELYSTLLLSGSGLCSLHPDRVQKTAGVEGVVLWFDDGRAFKIKTDWYFERAKKLTNFSFQEKDLWRVAIEGRLDDMSSSLGEHRMEKLNQFSVDLNVALAERANARKR